MPDVEEWKMLIRGAVLPTPVKALHYLGITYQSCSKPALMACSDNHDYVVKWYVPSRMIANDQIVGILGKALGAPVPEVRLVELVPDLIHANPALKHFRAGICHGSRFIKDVSENRENFNFTYVRENRARFALLAVLYGLAFVAGDHQFLYKKQQPRLVYSHDHGHFFPKGPDWTLNSLASAPTTALDDTIIKKCDLAGAEITEALRALQQVDTACIAMAVAAPPEDWGLSLEERVALAIYLEKRRDYLLALVDGFAKGD
nr:hypothetical protein P413_11 [uncultured bacterium]